ncbi:MAG: alpha/beta fold hydrolase [Smithellaceae bacterium]
MADQSNMIDPIFKPRRFLQNGHLQSILASSHLLVRPPTAFTKGVQNRVFSTTEGTRLLACITCHPQARGLIILLHGWEGSADSAYMLATGSYFYALGFSIIRLNLRDHGESHHLNEGLFHGALINETFEAIRYASQIEPYLPAYLIGFSLGANFALRVAIRHASTPIENLRHIFAISPPLNPYKTTLAIDSAPAFYRTYFLKKWKRSLRKKQSLFPHLYDFNTMLQSNTCLELTEKMMEYFPQFPSFRDYFKLYTLTDASFAGLNLPVRLFIAKDDPVIPADDFDALTENDLFRITRADYGGHCGFIDLFPYRRWYQEIIRNILGSLFTGRE